MAKVVSLKKAYGNCTGPLGFPMLDEVAKAVDALLKTLSPECKEVGDNGFLRVFKAAPDKFELKEGERSDVSVITSTGTDRDQEWMLPAGANWTQFRKNAVVTFAHQYDALPVGKNLWMKRIKEGNSDAWIGKTWYIDKPEGWSTDWFPDAVWHMVKNGVLVGKSIGFIATKVSPPEQKEIKANPEMANVRRVIREWTALEYAVAPVQSNPDATTIAVSKAKSEGIVIPKSVFDSMGIVIGDDELIAKKYDFLEEVPDQQDTQPQTKNVLSETDLVLITRKHAKRILDGLDIKKSVQDALDQLRGKV